MSVPSTTAVDVVVVFVVILLLLVDEDVVLVLDDVVLVLLLVTVLLVALLEVAVEMLDLDLQIHIYTEEFKKWIQGLKGLACGTSVKVNPKWDGIYLQIHLNLIKRVSRKLKKSTFSKVVS